MIWGKFVLGALALAALAAMTVVILRWHRAAQELPLVQAEYRRYVEKTRLAAEHERDVVRKMADENKILRETRAAVPVRIVRVPISPAPATVPAASSGSAPSAPVAGELPPVLGSDIGPRLYSLADAGDAIATRLRGCQQTMSPQ